MLNYETNPWHGDWNSRIKKKLTSLGYRDLQDFLDRNPAKSYTCLAKEIGDAIVAPVQLAQQHIKSASSVGRLREAAADSLVRYLAQHTRGWQQGKNFSFNVASAFSAWKTSIVLFSGHQCNLEQKLDAVIAHIEHSHPPKGWCPKSSKDSIVRAALDSSWPRHDGSGDRHEDR